MDRGFEWCIVSVQVTVGELKRRQKEDIVRGPTDGADVAVISRKTKRSSRHVEWHMGWGYALIREGVPLTEAALDAKFKRGELKEEMLFIFKHRDPEMNRNEDIPLFEAAFLCAPPNTPHPAVTDLKKLPQNYRYIRAQKRHLDQAYSNSGMRDKARMWNVDETSGVPYWVDRHAFTIQNERAVKERHEEKKRRQRKSRLSECDDLITENE